jgi:putative transposase
VVRRKKARLKGRLCADKGYFGKPVDQTMRAYGYIPHVRTRGQQVSAQKANPHYQTRRWVVERTHSWLNRFRKILVRFEKKAASYEALLELACALIVFRQIISIYG